MSIMDLANVPVTMKLAGKNLQIKRLSIGEFFGIAESKVKEQYINNIQTIASMLVGKEKMEYLSTATRNIPKGDELHQDAMNYLNSPSGIAELLKVGLNKLNKLSDEEISGLILSAAEGEVQYIVQYLVGIENDKVVPDINLSSIPEVPEKKTV